MERLDISSVIGILGAGTMGRGIAQVAASAGHKVILYDVNSDAVESARTSLNGLFDKLVEKEKYSREAADEILNKISYSDSLDKDFNCSFYIEAVVEDLKIKQQLFSKLEEQTSSDTILATNTSSIAITAIASACKHPERVIGIHFFNPAPLMNLVEIVPGILTSAMIVETAQNLIAAWGKSPVAAKDTPGFIVNRVARPFYGEALRILDEGIANIATIDAAMKEIGKFKMGPFELMDLIGNDVNFKVTQTVFEAFFYDPRYKPSFTQQRLVEAGLLGRKTGRGFYNYKDPSENPLPIDDENLKIEIFFRILCMLINEAADAVFLKIASVEDVDLAMTKGTNYPQGLLRWADEIGIAKVVKRLQLLHEKYGEDRYRVSPILKDILKQNKTFYG